MNILIPEINIHYKYLTKWLRENNHTVVLIGGLYDVYTKQLSKSLIPHNHFEFVLPFRTHWSAYNTIEEYLNYFRTKLFSIIDQYDINYIYPPMDSVDTAPVWQEALEYIGGYGSLVNFAAVHKQRFRYQTLRQHGIPLLPYTSNSNSILNTNLVDCPSPYFVRGGDIIKRENNFTQYGNYEDTTVMITGRFILGNVYVDGIADIEWETNSSKFIRANIPSQFVSNLTEFTDITQRVAATGRLINGPFTIHLVNYKDKWVVQDFQCKVHPIMQELMTYSTLYPYQWHDAVMRSYILQTISVDPNMASSMRCYDFSSVVPEYQLPPQWAEIKGLVRPPKPNTTLTDIVSPVEQFRNGFVVSRAETLAEAKEHTNRFIDETVVDTQ